jgi:hypothetical protein
VKFSPAQVFRGCVRAAKFISARLAVILFREVSFLIGGDFLIRSLPLAVLTHPVYVWVRNRNTLSKPH